MVELLWPDVPRRLVLTAGDVHHAPFQIRDVYVGNGAWSERALVFDLGDGFRVSIVLDKEGLVKLEHEVKKAVRVEGSA